ncbi:MAG: C10 family peptidase [Muribaculaceae bacterium]|nr:C10 family peptidase [Muribaculaceae bacterium]
MKKLLLLMTLAVVAMAMSAAPVDQRMAQKKAQNYLVKSLFTNMAPGTLNPSLKLAEASRVKGAGPVYYIFTTSNSYAVVAGDDRAEEILAYGDYCLDIKNIPPGLQDMLNQYRDAVEFLQKNPGLKVDPVVSPANTPSLKATSVGPLLTCNWDQLEPYWDQCVINGTQCYTGCPATSAAMVFYYWKYPTDPTPVIPAYDCYLSTSYWGGSYVNVAALPSITFDWDNMLADYTGNYSTAQANAVATLMRYIGQAEHMDYGNSNAGGSGVDADSVSLIAGAFTLMGYDPESVRVVKKTSAYSGGQTLYTDAEWAEIIQTEMLAERPIVFCAVDGSGNGGHAFNVDGYNSSTNKYHINFGWSGDGNDWCSLNAFGYSYYNFDTYQQAVIGIQPPLQGPGIQVSPSMLNMQAYAEKSSTATFKVKGQEITGNITLTLNDPNGCFTIDANSVAASDFEDGKVITVTYAPQNAGTHTATITLSNPGAEDKTVTLNGTATLETFAPVMQPANETYINLTQFRADWTDQTLDKYVESYTLKVNTKPSVALLDSLDGSNYPDSYQSITLTDPWSGNGVKAGNSAYYFSNYSNDGYISYTVPDGYANDVFSLQITSVSGTYGSGNLTVGSTQTSAVGHQFSQGETYTWLVTASEGEQITITSTDSYYSPDMSKIRVYVGNVNELNSLNAVVEEGDANSRLITGITDKFYTVKNLEAEGTFFYKVKALYTDGTESAWSNTQSVTLFENGPVYQLGDVNHDGEVTIKDVTALIDYLLGTNTDICTDCADVSGDGEVTIKDVTALIDMLLSGN